MTHVGLQRNKKKLIDFTVVMIYNCCPL